MRPICRILGMLLPLGILMSAGSGSAATVTTALSQSFDLSPVVLAPPVLVLALAALRVDILAVIVAGILSSVPLCMAVQGMGAAEVLRTAVAGYAAPSPELAALAVFLYAVPLWRLAASYLRPGQ